MFPDLVASLQARIRPQLGVGMGEGWEYSPRNEYEIEIWAGVKLRRLFCYSKITEKKLSHIDTSGKSPGKKGRFDVAHLKVEAKKKF